MPSTTASGPIVHFRNDYGYSYDIEGGALQESHKRPDATEEPPNIDIIEMLIKVTNTSGQRAPQFSQLAHQFVAGYAGTCDGIDQVAPGYCAAGVGQAAFVLGGNGEPVGVSNDTLVDDGASYDMYVAVEVAADTTTASVAFFIQGPDGLQRISV